MFYLLIAVIVVAIVFLKFPAKPKPQKSQYVDDWTNRPVPAWSKAPEPEPEDSDDLDDFADDDFDWQTSENGNETCAWNFLNATVFQQDGGWKYVINVAGGTKEDATYSQRFRSRDQAIVKAEEHMQNLFDEALIRHSRANP